MGALRFPWLLVGCQGLLNYPSIFVGGVGRSNLDVKCRDDTTQVFLGGKSHRKILTYTFGGHICHSNIKKPDIIRCFKGCPMFYGGFFLFGFLEWSKQHDLRFFFFMDSETSFRSFPQAARFLREQKIPPQNKTIRWIPWMYQPYPKTLKEFVGPGPGETRTYQYTSEKRESRGRHQRPSSWSREGSVTPTRWYVWLV